MLEEGSILWYAIRAIFFQCDVQQVLSLPPPVLSVAPGSPHCYLLACPVVVQPCT